MKFKLLDSRNCESTFAGSNRDKKLILEVDSLFNVEVIVCEDHNSKKMGEFLINSFVIGNELADNPPEGYSLESIETYVQLYLDHYNEV